jgi:hypothetical protein
MKYIFTFIFFLFGATVLAQTITAKVIDKNTEDVIPYANIQTGKNAGTISNDEGFFTIDAADSLKTVTVSCMGYENKVLSIQQIKDLNYEIVLSESINQLNEVFISNKALDANTIIAKVKSMRYDNYNYNLNKYNVFYRTTDHIDFKNLEFEIDKASDVKRKQLKDVNTSLDALANKIRTSNMVQFADLKGKVYTLHKDSIKIEVEKATELLNSKNDFSIENIQEKTQNIILKYLDTTKTYKLKSGVFKLEDSLALNDEELKEAYDNKYNVSGLNSETKALLNRAYFFKASFLDEILDTELYEYFFDGVGYNNDKLTYSITFIPKKSKAKYTGRLLIADEMYAITQIDYKYYNDRYGQKVNLKFLLGVKYIANVSEGTILFKKDSSRTYHPQYIKHITGSYFYVNRPLKFIENSNKRSKISFDFKIEGQDLIKEELLITAHDKLTIIDFKRVQQAKKIPVRILSKYEKTIWDNAEILEPTQEMKDFMNN